MATQYVTFHSIMAVVHWLPSADCAILLLSTNFEATGTFS